MTLLLALKNTRLSLRKRLPLALFLSATLALLFVGNTVFSGTESGLSRTFRSSLTADLSVSADSDDPFTLFGSELQLMGVYIKIPVILDYQSVYDEVTATLPEAQLQPVVVGAAKMSLEGFSAPALMFGVRIADYFKFFPELKILKGAVPQDGQPGVFLNEKMFARLVNALGREPRLGEKILLASAQDNSFSLREAPFLGEYSYPVYDSGLENVCLIDVSTGRALSGYFATKASKPAPVSSPQGSVDDLFADAQDSKAPVQQGISFDEVTKSLAEVHEAPAEDPLTWNFLLIRDAHPATAQRELIKALEDGSAPVRVLDWRDTAGGNAKMVWFIQVIFNIGLVFISVVAGMIVMNSMSLSVAERTKEFGTFRALGAQKSWVARLIAWETVILVGGSGLLGVAIGVALLVGVSATGGIPLTNSFVASLLGTQRYVPTLSLSLMLVHGALGLILGAVATIYPAFKSLSVRPVQAMARE